MKSEKKAGRWLATCLAAWLTACWLTLTCPPANGAEAGEVSGLAQRLAAATPGQTLELPSAADYRRPPAGLRPVSFPVAVGYKLTAASETQWVSLVDGEPASARPGLVAKVTGTVAGAAVALNYMVFGMEERELDVPQPNGQPPLRQPVPYVLTWGPLEPNPTGLAGLKLEVVAPAQPVRPTTAPVVSQVPTQEPALTSPQTATAASASTVEPCLSAAPTEDAPASPTTSALARPAEPNPTTERAPDPAPVVQQPASSQSGVAGNWVLQRRALAAAIDGAKVGQVLPNLPTWVTANPATLPQQWGWYLTKVRVADQSKFKVGQVVALFERDDDGQVESWVQGLVAGYGTETVAGKPAELAYVWCPVLLAGINGVSSTEPKN